MTKFKTLCDLDKKEIEKRLEEVTNIILNPKYMCRKCARVSAKKDYLCKPQRIKH
jgi:hypothetical protein